MDYRASIDALESYGIWGRTGNAEAERYLVLTLASHMDGTPSKYLEQFSTPRTAGQSIGQQRYRAACLVALEARQ